MKMCSVNILEDLVVSEFQWILLLLQHPLLLPISTIWTWLWHIVIHLSLHYNILQTSQYQSKCNLFRLWWPFYSFQNTYIEHRFIMLSIVNDSFHHRRDMIDHPHKKASNKMINNVCFSSVIPMLGWLKMNCVLYEFVALYPTLLLFKKRIWCENTLHFLVLIFKKRMRIIKSIRIYQTYKKRTAV